MNYKILVTEENRAAIKDIANRNRMNKHDFQFNSPSPMYYIKGNFFILSPREEKDKLEFKEMHFNQFKEMFDKDITVEEKIEYTLQDVLDAANYGYNYALTSMPEDNSIIPNGNILQWLMAKKNLIETPKEFEQLKNK